MTDTGELYNEQVRLPFCELSTGTRFKFKEEWKIPCWGTAVIKKGKPGVWIVEYPIDNMRQCYGQAYLESDPTQKEQVHCYTYLRLAG